jgi:hypothetical protein
MAKYGKNDAGARHIATSVFRGIVRKSSEDNDG